MKVLIRWLCDPMIDLLLVGVLLIRLAVFGGGGDPESRAELDRQPPSVASCDCSHDGDPGCASWKEVASCYVPAKEDGSR